MEAHISLTIAAKPCLVQISTTYGQKKEGGAALLRNQYAELRTEKPASKEEAKRFSSATGAGGGGRHR